MVIMTIMLRAVSSRAFWRCGAHVVMHAQQAGEICMIRKIECMVATFNGEEALKAKYCADCTDDTKAKTVQV